MTKAQRQLSEWLGKTSSRSGLIESQQAQLLAATLDRDPQSVEAGMALPPLWHWCFLLEAARHSSLGGDGHPQRGDFLPPVDLPRRMWAGSEIEFHKPIIIGDRASKQSRISNITQKQGKSGELVFVTVEHEIDQDGQLCLSERQTLVYREAAQMNGAANKPLPETRNPGESDFSVLLKADPALLFRYSAATFNAHRIHYDRDYAVQKEHYPGLLVHGPLLATLLLEQLNRHIGSDLTLDKFDFRAQAPVYDLTPFHLCGKQSAKNEYQLWVADDTALSCLQASATVAARQYAD